MKAMKVRLGKGMVKQYINEARTANRIEYSPP